MAASPTPVGRSLPSGKRSKSPRAERCFEDNPAPAGAVRRRHMADHLGFLERNAVAVRAAGPLHDAAEGTPAGGLWLVEAADRADVEALVHADPFWPTGLRRSVRVLAWSQVFADGTRRV